MKEETWIKKYGSDYKDHLIYTGGYRFYRKPKPKTSAYCCEPISNIENYELALKDDYRGWCIHHRLETHNPDGTLRQNPLYRKDLILLDLYYDRPSIELIWLTSSEHAKLHAQIKDPEVTSKRVNSLLGHKGNGRALAGIRKVMKWTLDKPFYTDDFFSRLDPNMAYSEFYRNVSKGYVTWLKFQDYVARTTSSTN